MVYTVVAMILTQLLVLLLMQLKSTNSSIALPGCPESCGGILVPYPFGIGPNCFLSKDFNVTCKIFNNGTSTPYLGHFSILNISLSLGQARISSPISAQCYNATSKQVDYTDWWYAWPMNPTEVMFKTFGHLENTSSLLKSMTVMDFQHTSFRYNHEKNKFVVIGCDTLSYVIFKNDHNSYLGGCILGCDGLESLTDGSCSGIGCCQTAIPKGASTLIVSFDERFNSSKLYNFSRCSYTMLVEEAEFKFNTNYITTDELHDATQPWPMVLDWAIGNTSCNMSHKNNSYACRSDHSVCSNSTSVGGYLCNCSDGYEGNPYLDGGCRDIDECADQNACSKPGKCHNFEGGYWCSCPFGWRINHKNPGKCDANMPLDIGTAGSTVALSFLGVGIYVVLERRNLSKVKKKYFQQHGGWILLEEIKSNQGFGFTIFTKQQIDQATKKFDNANILGHGGQGTVYRGTLRNQTVAIKKCKIVDENKKKQFGKEMLILSQINHKNIVKLLGCCLEVEVPILVYEFIANGTLQHYIDYNKQGSHISLATRLRIAHESAEALAYLHTSASPPIFHGDVKPSNILLDQNYMAKVSDFGASIIAPTDEAQFVTLLQGTRGYLDPEYMQSWQLTDKSDVYSFGVVLVELITSKPVIDFDAPQEQRTLSSRFRSATKENKIHDLLDDEIKHEDDMELIWAIIELAKECLNMRREERPMMKDVAEELYRIRKIKQHPWGQEYNPEETDTMFNTDREAEESIAFGR